MSAQFYKYLIIVAAGFVLLSVLHESPETTHYPTNDNRFVQGEDMLPTSIPMDHSRISLEEEFSSADVSTHLQLPCRRHVRVSSSQKPNTNHGVNLYSRIDRPPQTHC